MGFRLAQKLATLEHLDLLSGRYFALFYWSR